ncbi:RNA polymerase sigma-70 factor (ECF subfamily) [Mesorhizobium sp. J18]|uniref:RNA polymerase sigma factor n=1 Tax=Mesorhizobium sp. J18 TaxID=935263 RepID=UPI0011998EEF|nr:sigma-70 family RNA polymerase sigma factor [Mesorhizobium sp. J18]TWG97297.1 RNA polymerase sigma-70 factor (ECF subfamily) [Mesorhizobium sp. J18]
MSFPAVVVLVDRLKLAKLIGAFGKMRPRLEAVAQSRTGCRAMAEDLIQDVWLKLENTSFNGEVNNPGGFITQVANTTITGHLRKERRRAEINAEVCGLLWESVDEASPERVLIGQENLCLICAALSELPAKTQRIFLMNRIEQIPHRRIAEILGISDEAVYYHIRRALEQLAELRDELVD